MRACAPPSRLDSLPSGSRGPFCLSLNSSPMGKINFLQTDVLQLLEPWNSGEVLILDSIDNVETGDNIDKVRSFFWGEFDA